MIVEYFSGTIEAQLNKTKKMLADGITFDLDSGQTLALIGETGSGKTIVACSMMNLLPSNVYCRNTSFVFLGEQLAYKNKTHELLGDKIVYIPQSGHEYLNPSRKVKYQIYDSLKRNRIPHSQMKAIAISKLADVGLKNPEDVLEKYPFELSGGMAQRVAIAIATCSNAKLVIADEPTNGLEDDKKFEFFSLMKKLFPSAALLVITHDISVAGLCDNIIVLCKGKVMECGNTEKILSEPHHPYTVALIGAVVKNGMKETPRLREAKGQCPFYSRCEKASSECLEDILQKSCNGTSYYCVL